MNNHTFFSQTTRLHRILHQTGFFCSAPRNTVDAMTGAIEPIVPPPPAATAADDNGDDDSDATGVASAAAAAAAASYEVSERGQAGGSGCGRGVAGRKGAPPSACEQRGVLRTNCIDCLDRTNVAQFSVGVHALGLQLAAMGVLSSPTLEADSPVVLVLMDV